MWINFIIIYLIVSAYISWKRFEMSWHMILEGNKAVELEVYPDNYFDLLKLNFGVLTAFKWFHFEFGILWFAIKFAWSRKVDHAGIQLEIKSFDRVFSMNYYDIRHWDDEANTWKVD